MLKQSYEAAFAADMTQENFSTANTLANTWVKTLESQVCQAS